MIELDNVTVSYFNKPIFSNLNLRVAKGSFTGIVGPTGGGKSSLLRVILGLVPNVSGKVRLSQQSVSSSASLRIGYVAQGGCTDNFFPATVEQVIMMGLTCEKSKCPWFNRRDKQRVNLLAERLGISTCLQHHISDISGGQQQRAFLARALICDPELLILDEPTSDVDLRTQQSILQLLTELNNEGMTILITTHNLNGVASHLPRVLCFNRGIIAEGRPCEVFTDKLLQQTFGEGLSCIRHKGNVKVINHVTERWQVNGYEPAT